MVNLQDVQSKSIQIIEGLENKAFGQRQKEPAFLLFPQGRDFAYCFARIRAVSKIYQVKWVLCKNLLVNLGVKISRT